MAFWKGSTTCRLKLDFGDEKKSVVVSKPWSIMATRYLRKKKSFIYDRIKQPDHIP